MSEDSGVEFACGQVRGLLSPGGLFRHATGPASTFTDTPAALHREIIQKIESGTSWQSAVSTAYKESNPWLYRIICDPSRDRFFREIMPCSGLHILDVGSGWGQQALYLAKQNRVCSIEPSPERLDFIRAAARQMNLEDKMTFIQAELQELIFQTQFDLVTCIGVLEWAGTFSGNGLPQLAQQAFLKRMRSALKPGGQCIIGIENRLGLKYLLGSRDDHTGLANVSTLDYSLANSRWRELKGHDLAAITYTMFEYQHLLHQAGFSAVTFYCAFPDYKLPQVILPAAPPGPLHDYFRNGGFVEEHDGYDGRRLPQELQQTLQSHYRSLAELGTVACFSPSYFITARA